LKILVWDGTGMVLIYKVLEQGSFAWPKIQDGVMRLSRAQFGSSVRRSGLAAGGGATGVATSCGRMTHRVSFGVVLLGFLSRIG
jgi:transposase